MAADLHNSFDTVASHLAPSASISHEKHTVRWLGYLICIYISKSMAFWRLFFKNISIFLLARRMNYLETQSSRAIIRIHTLILCRFSFSQVLQNVLYGPETCAAQSSKSCERFSRIVIWRNTCRTNLQFKKWDLCLVLKENIVSHQNLRFTIDHPPQRTFPPLHIPKFCFLALTRDRFFIIFDAVNFDRWKKARSAGTKRSMHSSKNRLM